MDDSYMLASLNNNNNSNPVTFISNAGGHTSTLGLNSIKSKKFQKHTRKLLEIALEMLLKSPVPSVQYISLTTINRIFDIYVYHNLFYPGYYESCYIPLAKRRLNRIELQQKILNDQQQLDGSAIVQQQQQQQQQLLNSKTDEVCSCAQPFILKQTQTQQQFQSLQTTNNYYTNRFAGKMKELNSTIKEDPSDELNENNELNETPETFPPSPASPQPQQQQQSQPVGTPAAAAATAGCTAVVGPQYDETSPLTAHSRTGTSPRRAHVLTKAMSISHMAHRISGFLMRKLSISSNTR